MQLDRSNGKCRSITHEPGTDPDLKPCPFCGEVEGLEVCNTHTPSYWVECPCGAEKHGKAAGGGHYSVQAHVAAFLSAIAAWNARAPGRGDAE